MKSILERLRNEGLEDHRGYPGTPCCAEAAALIDTLMRKWYAGEANAVTDFIAAITARSQQG